MSLTKCAVCGLDFEMSRGDIDAVLKAAQDAYAAGLCVVPPAEDGSKRPVGGWRGFQSKRPTPARMKAWYAQDSRTGLGVVCGPVSGDLECLNFDDPDAYATFVQRAQETGVDDLVVRIEQGYCEETPSGGVHWLYRCTAVSGNMKLACRPKREDEQQDEQDTIKAMIETRGAGGYVVVAPSNGSVHPSGLPYRLRSGRFESIETLTPDERDALVSLARSLDEMPRPVVQSAGRARGSGEGRPGDDFNERAAWAQILEPNGWTNVGQHGDVEQWRRPGKTLGMSATTNHGGLDLLYVFTTSTALAADRAYSKFTAYAVLNHGDDFSAAARELARQGYGDNSNNAGGEVAGQHDAIGWPKPLGEAAYHGVFGDLVRLIEPHTESDPAALLVQTLVAFGSVIGRHAYYLVEADHHHTNLFALLVGDTAKGRKGTSWSHVRRLFRAVDEQWDDDRLISGLSTGEGLIWHVRDASEKTSPIKEKGRVVGYEQVIEDQGIDDKRLFVVESEFARTLRVAGREHNTLSPVIRQAWDTGNLNILTKNAPAKATNAHISIVGHITRNELKRYLTPTETGNGFANRFLMVCVKRSRLLPEGGHFDDVDVAPLMARLRAATAFARDADRLRRDDEARELWARVYPRLSAGRMGLLGAVTNRAEAQVVRLSILYALADSSYFVCRPHLRAAMEVWRYCFDSARYLFGGHTGDEMADRLLGALRQAGAEGLTRSQISSDVFGRNKKAATIDAACRGLVDGGLARCERDDSGQTRPTERWFAETPGYEIHEVSSAVIQKQLGTS